MPKKKKLKGTSQYWGWYHGGVRCPHCKQWTVAGTVMMAGLGMNCGLCKKDFKLLKRTADEYEHKR